MHSNIISTMDPRSQQDRLRAAETACNTVHERFVAEFEVLIQDNIDENSDSENEDCDMCPYGDRQLSYIPRAEIYELFHIQRFINSVANENWFGPTPLPYQHFCPCHKVRLLIDILSTSSHYSLFILLQNQSNYVDIPRRYWADNCKANKRMGFNQLFRHFKTKGYQSYLHQTLAEYLKVLYNLDDDGAPNRR